MHEAYMRGFAQKCAEAGVNPKMLVKAAQYGPSAGTTLAQLLRSGVMGGVPGALTAGPDRRTAGGAAGTLAQGLSEGIGNVGIQALLPKLRALSRTSPELAENLANILNLTNQLGSVAAGAGAGHMIGKLEQPAGA